MRAKSVSFENVTRPILCTEVRPVCTVIRQRDAHTFDQRVGGVWAYLQPDGGDGP
jgi:hypothetical protein